MIKLPILQKIYKATLCHLYNKRVDIHSTTKDVVCKIECSNLSLHTNGTNNIKNDLQIIIPVYNTSKYLSECLDSILKQKTSYSYEITLIDDGSSDNSLSICEEYKRKYKNIKLYTQNNQGLSEARNAGLNHMTGKYIMFVDSDDLIYDNTIEKIMSLAEKTQSKIIFNNYIYSNKYIEPAIELESFIKYNSLDYIGIICGHLYHYSLLENFRFPKDLYYEDTFLFFTIFYSKVKCIRSNIFTYFYRANPRSISTSKTSKSIDAVYVLILSLKYYFSSCFPNDVYISEKIISQMKQNYIRTKHLQESERLKIFEINFYLLNKYKVKKPISKLNRMLYQSIIKRKYSRYKFLLESI